MKRSTTRRLTDEELLKMAKGRPGAIKTGQLRNGQFVTLYFARLGGKNVQHGECFLFASREEAVAAAAAAKRRLADKLKTK